MRTNCIVVLIVLHLHDTPCPEVGILFINQTPIIVHQTYIIENLSSCTVTCKMESILEQTVSYSLAQSLEHLPAEFQESFSGIRNPSIWPCQEMELSDGPGLAGLQVFQVETSHQVIVAPYVFADQMHLENTRKNNKIVY